ncbi:EAL domain-containing protein [Geomonas sp. RF6]|uniref:putative bifunctional diguanylate cyclase/phosphodiesterase n=1 Tax=Geomonas sp. RF6 TaxID=2897342 RepID=UPI001E55503E|nr:GGDEF and EAL domain-containing protein [Geomonas sp. RF6]UFS69396.1 EAL domain-containing protein [Geomonas sp. RF6]
MTYPALSITKITTLIAVLLACVIATVLPAGYFAVSYENLAGRLEAEAEMNGRMVNRFLREIPALDHYYSLRLHELLSLRPKHGPPEIRQLLDMDGNELASTGTTLTPPLLQRHYLIMEKGKPVARLEISASYREVLVDSAAVAALGIILGITLYLGMRTLPLRAAAKAEEALTEANDFLSQVMQSSTNGIFVLDTQLVVMMANPRAGELLGFDEEAMTGRPFLDLLPEKEGALLEPLRKVLEGEAPMVHFEMEVQCDLPTPTVISCGAAPVIRGDAVRSIVISAEDITERKLAEEHILHMAYFDDLTGLPNRTFFSDQVESALALAQRATGKAAIMLVDLDNFKRINDTLGHRLGDQVLKTVSERLKRSLRKSDLLHRPGASDDVEIVARFGGDEFTILLGIIKDDNDPAIVAQRVIEAFAEPMPLEEHEVFVTMSIGISIYPKDGTTLDILLKNADTAMYKAKLGGKNRYQFYRHSMNENALARLTLENGLHKALEQGDFLLYYQPKMHLASGEITGVEALLRWKHPEIGMISPQEFIPIAEENGLIVPITEWVIAEACRQVKAWQTEGYPPLAVAVNISTHLFMQENLVRIVQKALEASGLEPKYLELEITESVMLQETSHTLGILGRLQQIGVFISIDDFGTGYSSFSYLKKLPVNAIKIDRSFIKDLSNHREDVAIVKAIIATGQSLGLKVVAEGVETVEQLHFLAAQGCDEMQGFLLSKPLPPDPIAGFVAQRHMQKAG